MAKRDRKIISRVIDPGKLSFFWMLWTIILPQLNAQEVKMNFREVDSETYRLYTEQKWDSLIYKGKQALSVDVDYFYLRLRLGIAYFEKQNYAMAAHHLEKAIQYNATDQTALEYLYYAYKDSNREMEARQLTKHFSREMAERIAPKKKVLSQVVLEAGPVFSDNKETNSIGNNGNQPGTYTEQNLYDNMFYWQAGAGIYPVDRASVYVGYDRLETDIFKQIRTNELVKTGQDVIMIGPGVFPHNIFGNRQTVYESNYTLNQHGIYANATIAPGNGFLITPAFHYLIIDYSTLYTEPQEEQYLAQVYDSDSSSRIVYNIYEAAQHIENSVVSLAVTKNWKTLTFGIGSSWSDLNFEDQIRVMGSAYWYPKGNLDYYFGSELNYAMENNSGNFIFNQLAGLKLWNWLWGEGLVTLGEMRNYNEKNGYVIYNSGDAIRFRAGANFIVPLYEHLEISLRYRYFKMQTTRVNLRADQPVQLQELNYTNHALIGGIQWKF